MLEKNSKIIQNKLHPIQIDDLTIPNNIWLAPLAGYSHRALREYVRSFGAGYAVTEMMSVDGLLRENKKTRSMLDFEDDITGVQIFGKPDPQKYYEAARLLVEKHGVRIVDINFGCPVKKVIRIGAGSALLKNPPLMGDLVQAVKDAGAIVSAKIRTGFDTVNIDQTIPVLNTVGADIIIVHGRTTLQGYGGNADWELLAKIRQMTDRIFIANGDVTTPKKAAELLNKTNADGIMIGRGGVRTPYLFTQILDYLQTGHYREVTLGEIKSMMLRYARAFLDWNPRSAKQLIPIRASLIQYAHGFRDSKEIRRQLSQIITLEDLTKVLENRQDKE